MTVLPFSPLQSSLNSISLAELERNFFWHDALLCCSMSKPRAISSGVTQFLESRGLPAFAMLACVAASNLARCSGVRRESMSSEIGGAPSIFPSLAISHKPGLTFSLMGSAASASSMIASAATAVPAIFPCVGCIKGLGGCADFEDDVFLVVGIFGQQDHLELFFKGQFARLEGGNLLLRHGAQVGVGFGQHGARVGQALTALLP